ncbi:hypothetical protein E3P83_00970 [Wallemia ichthyophaga]|nr:hypothetical protein E3P83_00970 [Wallemia ichthyophaga]
MNYKISEMTRNAVEKALEILQRDQIDEEHSHLLIKPIVLACQTSSSSIITLSLSALSRLINLKLVLQPVVSTVIAIIRQLISKGFEIQLKILQILLSLFNTTSDLHADEISECLVISFRLQDSKMSVVSSTASATLMQLVSNVFERVREEDKLDKSILDSRPSLFVDLEDGTSVPVAPNAFAAHLLFADAISLLNGTKLPSYINIGRLPTDSALDLVESCLKNHIHLFKTHPSLLYLVKKQLYPIIQSMLNDKHMRFAVGIRLMQITQILVDGFLDDMVQECREIWTNLIQILESNDGQSWMKCISLEVTQSLFSNRAIVINQYQQLGKDIFNSLLTAIARFVGEKAHVMGHNSDMSGLGTRYIPKEPATVDASSYSYVGEVAAMVGTNTANQPTHFSQRQFKLSADRKIKLRMMDQRDKHDAPAISDVSSLYVALLIILDVCNVFKTIVNSENLAKEMIVDSWPPIIATLSQYLNGEIDDDIFVKCIKSVENMAVVSGTLGLEVSRNAFLGLLYGLSCPNMAINAIVRWNERRSDIGSPSLESMSKNMSIGMTPTTATVPTSSTFSYPPPRLSNRNHICLGVLINLTAVLSNLLGDSWFDVLETLQNAHYVLDSHLDYERKQKQYIPSAEQGTTTAIADNVAVNIAQNSSDARLLYDNIEEIFKHSVDFNERSLEIFVHALCRLSVGDGVNAAAKSPRSSTRTSIEGNRASGGKEVRSSVFAISKIDVVGQLNLRRLMIGDARGWLMVIETLLMVVGGDILEFDSILRVEASEVLNRLLIGGLSAAQGDFKENEKIDKAAIQKSVLNALKDLSSLNLEGGGYSVNNILKTIRESGLDTLHKCLESAGDGLVIEWDSVLNILATSTQSKQPTEIKKAFEVVNLVCNDFLDELSVGQIENCVKVLTHKRLKSKHNAGAMPLRSAKSSNSISVNSKRSAFGDVSNQGKRPTNTNTESKPVSNKRASSFSEASNIPQTKLRIVQPSSKLHVYNEDDQMTDDDGVDDGPPDIDLTDEEDEVQVHDHKFDIEEADEEDLGDNESDVMEQDDIDEDDWVMRHVEVPSLIEHVNHVQSNYKEDLDFWDTTMVAEYAPEIFSYMCEQEIETMANPHYMDFQSEIEWSMRSTLIDWLLQVHLRYHMLPETLWIAINIIDRFLSVRVVSLVKLQLVGVTAMFIAAKYEEILAPSVDEFVYMTENGYTREEILKGERIILQTLNFSVSSYSSPYTWVRRISKADDYDIQTRTLSKFIMEVALLDHRFLRARPSLTAAVGMYVSRLMLGGDWNEDFVYYSGFSEKQLEKPTEYILETLCQPRFDSQFCYKKYSNKKFLKASIFARDWALKSS